MENIKIRKATMNDLHTILVLNNKLFEYEMERNLDKYINGWTFGQEGKDYFSSLIKNHLVLIAAIDNNPIGYLAGSIYQDATYSYYEGKTACLDNMYIEEEHRHFGIGSKLVNSFISWCKEQKAKRVFVTATNGNDSTLSFYKKHGFNELNIELKKEL